MGWEWYLIQLSGWIFGVIMAVLAALCLVAMRSAERDLARELDADTWTGERGWPRPS